MNKICITLEDKICQWFYEYLNCDSESMTGIEVKEFVRSKIKELKNMNKKKNIPDEIVIQWVNIVGKFKDSIEGC